jgi:hypothetical protein
MYAYTFTEPVDPELSYHAQEEEEEALYQYQAPTQAQDQDEVQAQAAVTTHQSDIITNPDIYIDRRPITLDLSSANLDECLEWLTAMPQAPLAPLAPAMPTSLRITPPNHNVIEALGIYRQQYNNNTNLIP